MESQPVRLPAPVLASSRENDQRDRFQLSITDITDANGRQTTVAVTGIIGLTKALSRLILSCGLVVALIVVPAVAILAHTSMLDKVVCSLGGIVVGGLIGVGAWAKRWLAGRSRKRRDQGSAAGPGHG